MQTDRSLSCRFVTRWTRHQTLMLSSLPHSDFSYAAPMFGVVANVWCCCKCLVLLQMFGVVAGVPEFVSITCLKFNGDFKPTKGLWLYNTGVKLDPNGMVSECAFFDSSIKSKLELPYFSNALDKFSQFALSLWFKRSPGSAGTRSLVDNSDCVNKASILLTSDAGSMRGMLRTDGDNYTELFDPLIANDLSGSATFAVMIILIVVISLIKNNNCTTATAATFVSACTC